jgi:hypothetical protein
MAFVGLLRSTKNEPTNETNGTQHITILKFCYPLPLDIAIKGAGPSGRAV